MRITIKQSGGLSGAERVLAAMSDDQLPRGNVERISEHVNQLLALRARSAEPIGADLLRYEIELSQPGTPSRRVTVIDEGDPDHPAMKHVFGILELVGVGR